MTLRMGPAGALAVCALVAIGINVGLHDACERLPEHVAAPGALMPVGPARVLWGAHKPLAADIFWLRAVEHYGNPRMQLLGLPHLLPLLTRVTAFDPLFAGAYQFAGTAIDYAGPAYDKAMALLDAGMRHCPNAWRIAFFSGFNAYYYAHDYPRAAANLAIAARADAAPPQTAALATRLSAEAGLPEVGIELVDALLERTPDDDAAQKLQERRRRLELDVMLRTVDARIGAYRKARLVAPRRWQDLIDAGLLTSVPHDPWGAPFLLHDGAAASIHDGRRLRLAPEAKGRARASR